MAVRQPAGVVARHRALERTGHPRHARGRHAARFGNTVILKASEVCPRTPPRSSPGRSTTRACRAGVVNLIDITRPRRRRTDRRRADRPSGACAASTSPARRSVGRLVAENAAQPSQAACCSSSAARRRWSCWPTPTSTRRWRRRTFGAFMHQGQICMSTERIVADPARWRDAFAATLGERARR